MPLVARVPARRLVHGVDSNRARERRQPQLNVEHAEDLREGDAALRRRLGCMLI